MGSRFILGFGIAFITCASPALLSELAHPRFRGTLVSLFNPFWYLGSITVAWTCFGTSHMDPTNTWNWRIPSLLQSLCPVIVLSLSWLIPESPRWLMSKGRKEEAKAIIAKYHGNGNVDDPLVLAQVEEIEMAVVRAQEGITWKALFRHKPNLQRLFIIIAMTLMTLWCGQNIITYYFSSILNSINITGTTQQ
jgi:MFS family permease